MPIYSGKKGDIIEKNKKYFDISYSDHEDFFTLAHRFEEVCDLNVKKDFSIYKIEFLNRRGKPIHLPYVYPSKYAFKRKFGIDPEQIIEEQKNIINLRKQKKTQITPKKGKIGDEGKTEVKAQNIVESDVKERIQDNKSEDKTADIIQNRHKQEEKVLTQNGDKTTEKIIPKKEGFIKRTLNKWKAEREVNRQREEKERKNLKLALYGMTGVLVFGTLGWKYYLDYTDEDLVFPTIEDGSLNYYNTDISQNSEQTQNVQQSENQTHTQDLNNTEPTTIEGKSFTGDISDFFNENTVIISHSRMNGIKHLLPESIKEENYHAVDGATIANGIEWMQSANEDTTITRVYISMGVNDLNKDGMKTLIEEAHKKFPNAIIFVQEEYVANRFDENTRKLLKEFNEHSKELCSQLDYAYYLEITNNKNNLAHENGDIIGEEDEVYGNKDAAIHIVDPEQQKKLMENMRTALYEKEVEIYLNTHQNTTQNSTTDQSTENINSTGYNAQSDNNNNTENNGAKTNVYYVSKEDSTDEYTCKTISEAVEKAQSGDTIIVKQGTYNEKVKIHNKQNITIKAEGEVIIDGTDLDGSLFSIKSSKNVYVQGFIFAHMLADNSQGVKVYGNNTSDITIDNCTFKDIKCVHEKDKDKGSNAIYVQGSSTTSINNVRIINCSAEDVGSGFSEVFSLEGNITNFLIDNVMITSNTVYSNIGICVCGNQGTCKDKRLDRPRKGTISNCKVFRCKSFYDKGSAYGIYVDVGEDIVIYNNTISLCEGGIEIGAEIASPVFSGIKNGDTEKITVRNNYILNCDSGVQIGGFQVSRGTVCNVIFENNEIEDCGKKDAPLLTLTKCNNIHVKNNKFKPADDQSIIIDIEMPEKYTNKIKFVGNEFKGLNIDTSNSKRFGYKGKHYNFIEWTRKIEHISMEQGR